MRKAQPDARADEGAANLDSVIQHVSATSITEIDKLISELQTLRGYLQTEGQRLERELAGYVRLNRVAMDSARVIGESLTQWNGAVEAKRAIVENDGR